MIVAQLEDIVDDDHVIVSLANGQLPFYVPLMSICDKEKLEPNSKILLSKVGFCVVGVLDNVDSSVASKLRLETAPRETFADVGQFLLPHILFIYDSFRLASLSLSLSLSSTFLSLSLSDCVLTTLC